MKLKDIFNINYDIDDSNIIIKSFKYIYDEENNYYNLEVAFNIFAKGFIFKNYNNMLLEKFDINKEAKTIKILFKNVSNFSVRDICKQMPIMGLEIIDNKERGWQKEKRYEITDFENNVIHLFCEKIILLNY